MKKIFVSYTYRDKNVNREFLRKVQIFLKKYSIPYIDIFDNKSPISSGVNTYVLLQK